jgi:hypothetical protein
LIWLSAIVYNGGLILHVLFNTESCDSSYRLLWGITDVWILCKNSGLPFYTGSRYRTPRIVQYVVSLLASFIAGSHWRQQRVFNNLKD